METQQVLKRQKLTMTRQSQSGRLEIRGVSKNYGNVRVLDHIDIDVPAGTFLTILGPSGSGKTTLLKIIAGFEASGTGSVVLAGKDIGDLDASRRNIGMVFQNYALFPHMTVAQNVGFPLRMRGQAKAEIRHRVGEALELVGLSAMSERLPRQLSGGQQQRVALARAVVFRPALLLLDEPFGALDRKLRETMQLEVRRLQQRLELTTLFITHDQEEALLMSDQIAVLSAGKVQQFGLPRDIYETPQNTFVADFVGESNLLSGVVEHADGALQLRLDDGTVFMLAPQAACAALRSPEPGRRVGALLRPERLFYASRLEASDSPRLNRVEGRVLESIYVGNSDKYRIVTPQGLELIARLEPGRDGPRPQAGDTLHLAFHTSDLHLVETA